MPVCVRPPDAKPLCERGPAREKKPAAPTKIINTIEFINSVDLITSLRFFSVSLFLIPAKSIAPIAPTEADSVGVAKPVSIDPKTKTISSKGGNRAKTTFLGNSFFCRLDSFQVVYK